MKKLMILIGAVATSIGLYAADVAEIVGGAKYTSLRSAVEAAKTDGQVVRLLQDTSEGGAIYTQAGITIDFCGFKFTNTAGAWAFRCGEKSDKGKKVTFLNGTIFSLDPANGLGIRLNNVTGIVSNFTVETSCTLSQLTDRAKLYMYNSHFIKHSNVDKVLLVTNFGSGGSYFYMDPDSTILDDGNCPGVVISTDGSADIYGQIVHSFDGVSTTAVPLRVDDGCGTVTIYEGAEITVLNHNADAIGVINDTSTFTKGSLVIKGGTISGTRSAVASAIPTTKVEGGVLTAESGSAVAVRKGSVEISGGEISSENGAGVTVSGSATGATISGGSIEGATAGVSSSVGTVTVEGDAEIAAGTGAGVEVKGGTANITGGSITSEQGAGVAVSGGKAEVSGGSVEGATAGVETTGSATASVSGGEIKAAEGGSAVSGTGTTVPAESTASFSDDSGAEHCADKTVFNAKVLSGEGLVVASVVIDGTPAATPAFGNYLLQGDKALVVTYALAENFVLAEGASLEPQTLNTDNRESVPPQTVAAVAKIDTDLYTTFDAAFAAAEADDTITLLADIELEAPIAVAKKVTLNIGNYDITPKAAFTRPSGSKNTIDSMFAVRYGGDFTVIGDTGVIDCSAFPTIYSPIKMTEYGEAYDGSTKATLTVNANLKGYYYAITGNGGRPGTVITVNGGILEGAVADESASIYHPQGGTLTINGGTFKGDTGLYIKAGDCICSIGSEATIIATGTKKGYVAMKSGFQSTGDAFVIDNADYPAGTPTADIKGGTFESANGAAVASYAKAELPKVVGFVAGGKFKGAVALDDALVVEGKEFVADGEGYYEVADQTFTVTYKVEGEEDASETVVWGQKPASIPTPVAKEGYTGAWDVDPATVTEVKADMTFTYTYTEDVKPIEPAEDGEQTVEIKAASKEEAEQKAAEAIQTPDEAVVSKTDYAAYFKTTATAKGDGTFDVKVELDPTVVTPVIATEAAAGEEPVKVVPNEKGETAVAAKVENVKPGLWYGYKVATELGGETDTFANDVGSFQQAKSTGSLTLKSTPQTGKAAFFKISVSPVQPKE